MKPKFPTSLEYPSTKPPRWFTSNPATLLPERRKQRAYLSSILAKNEIEKDDKHNRKLFYRVMRGAYIFNPGLAIKVAGEWVNIYDLLNIDKLVLNCIISRHYFYR